MYKTIPIALLVVVSFKILNACNRSYPDTGISAIEVRDIDPVMGETFYRVFHTGNFVMYQCQYRFDSSTIQMNSKEVNTLSQWRSKFFVFQKDSSYGYIYDPNNSVEDGHRFEVDPVLKFIQGTNTFDSFLAVKPDSTVWNINKTELTEVFLMPEKKTYLRDA